MQSLLEWVFEVSLSGAGNLRRRKRGCNRGARWRTDRVTWQSVGIDVAARSYAICAPQVKASPVETHTHLDQSRVVRLAGDDTELRTRNSGIGPIERRRIGDVQSLGAKLRFEFLRHRKRHEY